MMVVRSSAATAATALAVAVLALAPAAGAGRAAAPPTCSSFGPSWARSYNAHAARDGNPVRILGACCRPGVRFGLNSCFITVTLTGTRDRGCELAVINDAGAIVGAGRHETCPAST